MTAQERKDLSKYRIDRTKEILTEVEDILIKNKLYSTAINRLYYGCYYAVIGLLILKGMSSETHKGTRMMFGLHVVKKGLISREPGKFYADIFNKRHSCDYDDFIEITEEDAKSYLLPAKELIKALDKLIEGNSKV